MSQEDNYATEIEHGAEVIQLSLPASNQAPEIVQPVKRNHVLELLHSPHIPILDP